MGKALGGYGRTWEGLGDPARCWKVSEAEIGRQASMLDRPALSMSRGLSAAWPMSNIPKAMFYLLKGDYIPLHWFKLPTKFRVQC